MPSDIQTILQSVIDNADDAMRPLAHGYLTSQGANNVLRVHNAQGHQIGFVAQSHPSAPQPYTAHHTSVTHAPFSTFHPSLDAAARAVAARHRQGPHTKPLPPLKKATLDKAPPGEPNRVYIGRYHQLPPGARRHIGPDGRPYYIPDETSAEQQTQTTKPSISPAQQQEYAERYTQVVEALKERLNQYTQEIQRHLQEANTAPVDPAHLHDLNEKVQQIQGELQTAQANLDQYQQAEGGE